MTAPNPDSSNIAPIRLMIVMQRRLDGEALAALLATCPDFLIDGIAWSVDEAAAAYDASRPHVVLLDGALVDRNAGFDGTSFLPVEEPGPMLLLDQEVHYRRLTTALKRPLCGYFTRHAPFTELAAGVRRLAAGESAVNNCLAESIPESARGWRESELSADSPLAKLTPRQLQVMRLLAMGNTVPECAEILQIAATTVDNHKSRLMKKLSLHRTADLIRLALREGLIHL